jgi:glycosyltransferase involved in cell wall biosynthesis
LWFISKIEFETYSRSQLAQKVQPMWLPPSLNLKNMPRRTRSDSKRVLFVGGLANPLNQEGIRWYLSKVHPNLKSFPDYEFVIAGSAGKSESARLLALEADGIDRCSVQLDIENLNPLYDSCALLINPMRNGSGVKMKTVHAVQHNIPLVTTTVGAEGSGLVDREHIRVADEPEEFLSAVSDLLSNPAMGDSMSDRAYRYLAANYNSDENIERLLNLLLGPSTKAEPVLG